MSRKPHKDWKKAFDDRGPNTHELVTPAFILQVFEDNDFNYDRWLGTILDPASGDEDDSYPPYSSKEKAMVAIEWAAAKRSRKIIAGHMKSIRKLEYDVCRLTGRMYRSYWAQENRG